MISVNLIPMSRRMAAARRRRVRCWGAAGVVYVLALGGVYGAVVLPRGAGAPSLDARIQEVAVQTQQSEDAIRAVTAELEGAQGRLRAIRRVTGHPDWSVLLGLVSEAREGQIVFDLCELTPGGVMPAGAPGYILRLNGIGRRQQEIPMFVMRLEALRVFSRVSLLESQSRQLDEADVFGFRIECTLKDGGGLTP